MFDSPYMRKALASAEAAGASGEVPIGAVIVERSTGVILAIAHNLVITQRDPSAHAEVLAIREACQKRGSERLDGCDLYVTLEPCPMCAQAISFARIGRLYYAASDPKGGGVEHGPRIFSQPTCHHKPELYPGMLAEEAGQQLKAFFKNLR